MQVGKSTSSRRGPRGASAARAAAKPHQKLPALLRKEHLVARLFVPLVMAIVCLTVYNGVTTWQMGTREVSSHLAGHLGDAGRLMKQLLDDEEFRLRASLDTFMQDDTFKQLMRARDREGLLAKGAPLFRHLSEEYNLTRFYFIEPDGTAFARLHRPDDYGQKVTHPAVQRAMETTQAASGLELGRVAFALRVVAPYYDGDELIGYIEFGEDIDHILRVLSGTGAEHISVVIEKQYLDRAAWESAAHAESGGAGEWDEYTDVVLSSTTFETLPPEVGRLIADGVDLTTARLVSVGDTVYGIGRVPLTDLLGRRAGYAIMMHDATARVVAVREAVRAQALAGAGIAIITAGLLYIALRSTIRALSSSRTALRIHAALLGEALGREQQMSQTLSIFLAEPELDRALPLLADAARTLTKAGASVIVLRDPHTGTVGRLATSGTPELPGPPQPLFDESPALAVVFAADDLVSVDDVMALPDFTGYPDYHPKIRAMIGAPLMDAQGTFGIISVAQLDAKRRFSDEQKNAFGTFARLVTLAVRRAITVEQLQHALREAEAASAEARRARETAEQRSAETTAAYGQLLETRRRLAVHTAILEAASRWVRLDDTVRAIANGCAAELGFDSTAVCLLDRHTGLLKTTYTRGIAAGLAMQIATRLRHRHDEDDGPLTGIWFAGAGELADDGASSADGPTAVACVPLNVGDRPVGALVVASHEWAEIGPSVRGLLEDVVRLVQPALDNALQSEDLERFNRAAAGREDRVIEMKREVNVLLAELGREPRYRVVQALDAAEPTYQIPQPGSSEPPGGRTGDWA